MSDLGDSYKELREEKSSRNLQRQKVAHEDMEAFAITRDLECKVIQHWWHLRIGSIALNYIDIFPNTKKWHNIRTGERGTYKNLMTFLKQQYPLQ